MNNVLCLVYKQPFKVPFGMMMPGREYQAQPSRFGFNGKENDNEVKGFGNQQDYGMRIYNTRLGRFLSVDPITSKYPELTPYQFASNRPIDGIDFDGLEFYNSKSSRIAIGLQFDPVQKRITNFTTYYRTENIPDKLNEFISYYNTCSNCIGSSAAQVGIFTLTFKNPFIKTASEAEAKDAEQAEGTSVGPSSSGSKILIVPKDGKQARQQEKSRTFFTEGASPRIGRANAVLAGLDLATALIQKLGNDNLQSIVNTAKTQSVNGAVGAIAILQNAIDNNRLGGYMDQGSLVKLANYFLYGGKIEKYQEVNGKGTYVEDVELTKIAKELWDEYYFPIQQQKQKEESEKEKKPKVDNTGRNNKGGF